MLVPRLHRVTYLVGLIAAVVVLAACGADSGTTGEAEGSPDGQTVEDTPTESAEMSTADILGYDGDDREEFLYEGAQEEGTLTWYTGHTSWEEIKNAFEEEYPGVTVEVFSDPEVIAQRITEESQAGRSEFDVYEDVMGKLPRTTDHFAEWETPAAEGTDERMVDPLFKGTRGFMISVGYNPNLVEESELPGSWEDLTAESWAGQIGMGSVAPEVHIVGVLYETHGEELLRSLAENVQVQDVSTRAIADQIRSGEIPLTLSAASSHALQAYQDDAPMRWLPMDPMIASWGAVSIAREPSSPHAAALFADWLLSEDGGRDVYRSLGNAIPVAEGRLIDLPYLDEDETLAWVDPVQEYDDYQERYQTWEELLRNIFIRGN